MRPGIYHYCAFDHTLGRLDTDEMPSPSELMGGQEWADEMPCVIVLCALLERTMWKYEDANAYRVVLIEAGHIGQNLMLAATRRGLSACPSAALNHSRISKAISSGNRFTHSPIYALTLGSRLSVSPSRRRPLRLPLPLAAVREPYGPRQRSIAMPHSREQERDMPIRTSDAEWKGTLKEGQGHMRLGSQAFEGRYSFASRFEDGGGTNPEELVGAAHAGCFSMALAGDLGRAGFAPEYVRTRPRSTSIRLPAAVSRSISSN